MSKWESNETGRRVEIVNASVWLSDGILICDISNNNSNDEW